MSAGDYPKIDLTDYEFEQREWRARLTDIASTSGLANRFDADDRSAVNEHLSRNGTKGKTKNSQT